MSLDDLVTVNISSTTQVPTRVGFGTPLLACANLPSSWARVTTYTTLASLATALGSGYATKPVYLMASALLAQNPSITSFKVGKRSLGFTQVIELTPVAPGATAGLVYTVTIDGTACSYTSLGTDVVDDICDGLATAINTAALGVTATVSPAHPNATKVICTAVANVAHTYTNRSTGTAKLSLWDATTGGSANLITDLTAMVNYDNDWYGLLLDEGSYNTLTGSTLSAWLAANKKILCYQTADDTVIDAAYVAPYTSDSPSKLKSIADYRSFPIYNADLNYAASCAMMGNRLPADPGSDTWAFKTLTGVTADALTPTQRTYAHGKNCNTYMTTSGISITEPGKSAGGEWMDVTRFVDWLRARLQERLFFILANRPKLPYTDASVDVVRGEVLAQLNDGIAVGGLTNDPKPVVTAPTVASVPSATRALRQLPGVTFSAQLAGAIHQLTITGTVTA